MATQPIPEHKPQSGSPYCSDPNCPYCKEVRRMFDQMRKDNGTVKKANRAVKTVSRG